MGLAHDGSELDRVEWRLVKAAGTRRLYKVDSRGVEAVRQWFDGFWDETLGAFKEAAERAAKKKRTS